MSLSATHWSVIEAARAGDEAAMEALFAKYRPAVVAYLGRAGFTADAEDLGQEVFLRLFRGGLRADASLGAFRSLVFTITRNVLRNHLEAASAKKRAGQRVPLDEATVAAAPSDVDGFDREWLVRLVEVALQRLAVERPNYHQALRLFLLEGHPQARVAELLGQTVQTVKNHVHRGKQLLIEYVREEVLAYSGSRAAYVEELGALARLLPP